jgi:hypothetical protein
MTDGPGSARSDRAAVLVASDGDQCRVVWRGDTFASAAPWLDGYLPHALHPQGRSLLVVPDV